MFRPDGTFELTQYSPANNTLSGMWGIRWATPRPTLGITINASDRPEHVGTKWELKIIELDHEALTGEDDGSHVMACLRFAVYQVSDFPTSKTHVGFVS